MGGVAATPEPGPRGRSGGRRLVINADDFGLSEGINRGIIEAVQAGGVSSVSLMVGMPASDDAVERARAAGRSLGVGLHLALTLGRPLTSARSLIHPATGEFAPPGRLLARALAGRLRAGDVEAECRAQLARLRATGLRVTHLDSHHHVHAWPGIHRVVRAVARADGIPIVRRPAEPLWGVPQAWRRLPKRTALALLARHVARGARGPRHVDHFAGLTLYGSPRLGPALVRLLDALPPGTTELMVHPGYVDGPLPGNDRYTWQREAELRALTSPEVLARLRGPAIELVHFGQL
jgi:predicted glycoside hydrolase/deacetylase ChbG (UPF0249 family)